jgi:hypothetical protein
MFKKSIPNLLFKANQQFVLGKNGKIKRIIECKGEASNDKL